MKNSKEFRMVINKISLKEQKEKKKRVINRFYKHISNTNFLKNYMKPKTSPLSILVDSQKDKIKDGEGMMKQIENYNDKYDVLNIKIFNEFISKLEEDKNNIVGIKKERLNIPPHL